MLQNGLVCCCDVGAKLIVGCFNRKAPCSRWCHFGRWRAKLRLQAAVCGSETAEACEAATSVQ